MDYVTLKTEIQTDPLALGYSALVAAGDDAGVATKLNALVSGQWIFDGRMQARQLFELFNKAEWQALSTTAKDELFGLLGMTDLDLTGENTRALLESHFAAGSTTRNAIIARVRRNPTRAEMLFGLGTHVRDVDVAIALRG